MKFTATRPSRILSIRPVYGWERFIIQMQQDAILWIFSLLFLGGFRLLMIHRYRGAMDSGHGWGDIFHALITGGRFDSMVAGYFILPSVILSLICLVKDFSRFAESVRWFMATLAFFLHSTICLITFAYFGEYHSQFNQWIFGLITDDRTAIARTIWIQYPILSYGICLVFFTAAWAFFWPKVCESLTFPYYAKANSWPTAWKGTFLLILGLALFFSIRGWSVMRPLKQRDISATRDSFLNKIVANPYIALRYAILDQKYLTSSQGLTAFLEGNSIQEAARRIFPHGSPWENLEVLSLRKASGRPGIFPRHIFVIVGESLDAWPLQTEFSKLGLADELLQLSREGIYCQAFVSSGSATSHALGTLVGGLPEAGVNTNYQPSSSRPFPTASAPIFKRLGYRTRFLYSGFPSWQRADEFCSAQGFDEVIGIASLKNLPKEAVGTWGALDEYLYRHILQEIPANINSFNVIFTTVNHPPYDVDVRKLGFPFTKIPHPFDKIYDGSSPMGFFGLSWYTAQSAAKFVREAQIRFKPSVFVVTGDHSSRRFLNQRPTLYQRTAVPFILAGPEVLQNVRPPATMAGSHADIIPTLVELCAETGFEYASLGRNMLAPDKLPAGFGCQTVVTPDFIFSVPSPNVLEALPGRQASPGDATVQKLRQTYQDLHALAWWWIMKGSRLSTKVDD